MIGSTHSVGPGKWLPGAVLGASLLTAVSMISPLPSFVPSPPKSLDTEPANPAEIELPGPIDAGQWSSMSTGLNALRPPPPEPPKPVEPAVIIDISTTDLPTPVQPLRSPLGWIYKGHIEDVPPYALVIMNDGRQRFLREGQSIDDPTDPGGGSIIISSVTDEELILDRNGVSETLRLDPTPSLFPPTAPGAARRPPGVNPSGANRGGARDPQPQQQR